MTRPFFAAAVLLLIPLIRVGTLPASADNFHIGVCHGALVRILPDVPEVPVSYEIKNIRGTVCNVPTKNEAQVLRVCSVGRNCKIVGWLNDCEGALHCFEVITFLSVTAK